MRKRLHLKYSLIGTLLLVILSTHSVLPEVFLEAMVDSSAKMPCNVLQKKDDTVEFIFWYKNDGVTALYTLDARSRPLGEASHIRNETYSDRVQFYITAETPYLQLDYLREEDSGNYFCRVDYQWSATELTKVNLIVVVPPKKLIIRDDSGQEVRELAGPYREKSDISLSCEAQKGFPPPNVTWWRDGKLWDNTFQKYASGVVNDLKLMNLSRSDIYATFYCKAQNTRLMEPVLRSVILDMYLYPQRVSIINRPTSISAGKRLEFKCESWGSRPPAKIFWKLNGTMLSDHTETVQDNVTSSILRLFPKLRHHKLVLSCTAENPKMFGSGMIDNRVLNITYVPQVSLRLIKEEADRQPKEDDYLRLVCEIDANPLVLKIGWLFQDLPLSHNQSRTDIVSGNTLVFKRLTRRNRGRYRCYATNAEGRGMSQELTLNISHAPVCKENQQITYVVGLNESVTVRCEVEAVPPDVTFKWEFSNTVHKHYNLQHTNDRVVSLATYRPVTSADYGTLFCWANNSIGHQQSSCFFTVIAPACKLDSTKVNASSLSRDGSENIWPHSVTTAVVIVASSVVIVIAVCAIYFRRIYLEKKQRPMRQILDERVSICSRVQCHSSGQQLHILIAK
ncbi:hemicentin-2-like [Uloborus diversus]|uniref:hemicentin-2-like n=1 Tax=Uloborus diversus TaxID=327109 RepID=UPI00240A8B29|nr:hemicentin-2-like [Uloborus diversus]